MNGEYISLEDAKKIRKYNILLKRIKILKKENIRLKSIIKEVREYIEENYIYVDGEGYSKEEEDYYVRKNKLLEILDKENNNE